MSLWRSVTKWVGRVLGGKATWTLMLWILITEGGAGSCVNPGSGVFSRKQRPKEAYGLALVALGQWENDAGSVGSKCFPGGGWGGAPPRELVFSCPGKTGPSAPWEAGVVALESCLLLCRRASMSLPAQTLVPRTFAGSFTLGNYVSEAAHGHLISL